MGDCGDVYALATPLLADDRPWGGIRVEAADARALAAIVAASAAAPLPEPLRLVLFLDEADDESPALIADALAPGRTLLARHPPGNAAPARIAAAAPCPLSDRLDGQAPFTADHLGIDSRRAAGLPSDAELPAPLIAVGVRDYALLDRVRAQGAVLWSCEYLARPRSDAPPVPDPAAAKLLRLLDMVIRDADNSEIEEAVKREPKLSYKLLCFANSAAVGASVKLTSFRQALMILGRRQLERWLLLLIFDSRQKTASDQPPPLALQAAWRGRLMEELAVLLPAADERPLQPDRAFITGVFSLLEALLSIPLPRILRSLALDDAISDALLERAGPLGDSLRIVEAIERGERAALAALLCARKIAPEALFLAQWRSLAWTHGITLPAA